MKLSSADRAAQIPLSFEGATQKRPLFQSQIAMRPEGDWVLLALVLTLSMSGLLMVYLSSSPIAQNKPYLDSAYFLKRQLLWFGIALCAFYPASRIRLQPLRKGIMPMAALVFTLLIAVLVLGREINGARRWLSLGPLVFQPSELAKLFTVLYLAHYLDKRHGQMQRFADGALQALILIGTMALLILPEPDFGTTVVILSICFLLLFLGGVPIKQLLCLLVLGLPLMAYWVASTPYRLERIAAFLDPWKYHFSSGFQLIQSQIALGSGGLTGLGLASGKQTLFFLLEPHTDFIFAIVGESFGLIGTTVIVLLFTAILWRGTRIALHADSPYDRILAFGLTLLITFPAMLNMGVVTGLLPTKGLPLPFVSYGGSSMLMNSITIALLYNLSRGQQVSLRRQEAQ